MFSLVAVFKSKDSLSVYVPDVKKGDVVSAKYVLSQLGIASSSAEGVRWGSAFTGDEYVSFEKMNDTPEIVPNVIGMGARDAAYLMGVRGLKVRMKGCGKVKSQSIAYGAKAKKGQTVLLVLD